MPARACPDNQSSRGGPSIQDLASIEIYIYKERERKIVQWCDGILFLRCSLQYEREKSPRERNLTYQLASQSEGPYPPRAFDCPPRSESFFVQLHLYMYFHAVRWWKTRCEKLKTQRVCILYINTNLYLYV